MKVKRSVLDKIIQEETERYFANKKSMILTENLDFMIDKVMSALGPEQMVKELVKRMNPKAVREILESLAKLYNMKLEENKKE